jgi:hypothetical protein
VSSDWIMGVCAMSHHELDFPLSIEVIVESAMAESGVRNADIYECAKLGMIGSSAFSKCGRLTVVRLPEHFTALGEGCFLGAAVEVLDVTNRVDCRGQFDASAAIRMLRVNGAHCANFDDGFWNQLRQPWACCVSEALSAGDYPTLPLGARV